MFKHRVTHLIDFLKTLSGMLSLFIRDQPGLFLCLVILLVIQGGIPLGMAWITKLVLDTLSLELHRPPPSLLFYNMMTLLAAQGGLIVASQLVPLLHQFLNTRVERGLALQMKTRIYQKINSFADLTYFEDPKFHNLIQLTTSSATIAPQQTLTLVTNILQSIVMIISFGGVLLALNPLLVVIVCIAAIPQWYLQLRFSRQRFSTIFSNSILERRATYYEQILSWMGFVKEVRLFQLAEYFLQAMIETTRKINHSLFDQQQRELRWQLFIAVLTGAVSALALFFVIWQAFQGRFSIGDISFYMSAVSSYQNALANIIGSFSQMNQNVLFYQQYVQLMALPPKLPVMTASQPVPPLKKGIHLVNVSFRYHDQQPWVLRHFDLFLPAGQCIAIVGLNGAGKTTLVKLLTRLYDPSEGKILWDDIDIRAFEPLELRQHLSTILQDFAHYDLSVQQNIGLGNIEYLDDAPMVQQAAREAGIHERIQRFPNGYQSLLGPWLAENGNEATELSGGEWQKIALARMFMRHPDLLILDEPSASLDAQAEYELYKHFRSLMQGHTCMLISHRFSTVRIADAIAVIEQGQICEYGTHEELMTLGGRYAILYAMQAESLIGEGMRESIRTE